MSTETFTELRVVTTAGWLARDLQTGTRLPVVHDLGLDLPADTATTAWWAPHQHVARLAVTPGAARPSLWSPGPYWLTQLGREHLHRRVWVSPLEHVADAPLWCPGAPVFAKPAEIKVHGLEARPYGTPAAATRAMTDRHLTGASMVVLSELVEFVEEYRCFVAPGPDGAPTVVAASPYLVHDVTWDAWEDVSSAPDPTAAAAFAQQVLAAVDGPPGYVVDVGRLADGRWAVVEANAAWSSNPYHCDPAGVVAAVLAAQDPAGDVTWAWRSDPYMDRFARALPVRSS